MVYNRHSHPEVRIIDLATGRVLWGAISANTSTGEVDHLVGKYESDRGDTDQFVPARSSDGLRTIYSRRRVKKIIPFDVIDWDGNVIDKCRP